MVEHLLAQIITDAFAQDTCQVDEEKNAGGLDKDHGGIHEQNVGQCLRIAGDNTLIDNALAEPCCNGVQTGHDGNCNEKTNQPLLVGDRKPKNAAESSSIEFRLKFLFF